MKGEGKMKKIKKQVLAYLLIAVLATLACGCGGSKGGSVGGNSDVLKIGVENKGYGDEFAYELVKAFTKKTGIEAEVVKSSSVDWIDPVLKSGAKNNDIDVFFDINEGYMKTIAVEGYLTGYDRAYVDLSDIYDAVPEGYDTDKTLEEIVFPYSLSACTWGGEEEGYGDGKQYFINWATGLEGLMYNVGLFEKYNLSVPKTTEELFKLMDKMKAVDNGNYAKNDEGLTIYPFAYSGKVNYTSYLATVWMAQYDGIETFDNMLKGKDADGNYSVNSLRTAGRLSAMQNVAKMLDQDKKYTDANAIAQSFTNVQVLFLDEQAFMMSTGDWLEREMSSNFDKNADIAFMKIPVNSDIIKSCTSIKTDKQLSEVVSYVDGDTKERPSYVTDEDLARIQSARSMYCCEGNQHVAYIPAYSNNVESAKKFLQFMVSKDGQEIMLDNAYGNMAMLNLDVSEFDGYKKLSQLQKSKYKLLYGATLVGNRYVHPMNYAGGVKVWYGDSMEAAFGAIKSSDAYREPAKFFMSTYNAVSTEWADWIYRAGVSN